MLIDVENGGRHANPVKVLLLGPVGIERDGCFIRPPTPLLRALLAALALAQGRTLGRDGLAEQVWGHRGPGSSRSTVAVALHRLRRWLRNETGDRVVIHSNTHGYAMELAAGVTDADQFRALVKEAAELTPAQAVLMLEQALRLWRGTPLEDVPADQYDGSAVAQLERERLTVLLQYAQAAVESGQPDSAIATVLPLADQCPLDEVVHAVLIEALAAAGRQAEALDLYEQVRARLADTLGVDPGAQLREVHLRVLRQQVPARATRHPHERAGVDHLGPAQLPADTPMFTGREDHLNQLDKLLDAQYDAKTAGLAVIAGTAGVGKTALALHWAHQVTERFPDGQLYVNLRGFDPRGPVEPAEALRGFLEALGVAPQRIPAGADAQSGLYRSTMAGKRLLVLLDNACDADQVRPLLPGTPASLVLVTSRNELAGLIAAEGARPLTLDLMPPMEARQLLSRRLGFERVAAEPDAVDEIISRCARLPLALVVAAARASIHPQFPLTDLTSQLMEARDRLDAFDGDDPATDVRAVFSWSYQRLGGEAARLFRLLGLNPCPDIGIFALASLAGADVSRARRLVAELTRSHMLSEHTQGRYAFHDLLRAYAVELTHRLDSNIERDAAVQRFLGHYLHTAHAADKQLSPYRDPIEPLSPPSGVSLDPPADYEQALAWFAVQWQSVLAAAGLAASSGSHTHVWQLAWTVTPYLDRRGHWPDLVSVQSMALAAAQRLGDNTAVALAHRQSGLTHARLGYDDDARAHLQRAIDIFAALGDHSCEASVHIDFGWMMTRRGSHGEALERGHRALKLYERADNRHGQANALNAIGWSLAELGDYRQAIAYCERAVALYRDLGSRREAATLDSIGFAYHNLGEHKRAADYYQSALRVQDLTERYNTAIILIHLGDAHRAAGAAGSAREAWEQALELLEQIDHPDADTARTKLRGLPPAGQSS